MLKVQLSYISDTLERKDETSSVSDDLMDGWMCERDRHIDQYVSV